MKLWGTKKLPAPDSNDKLSAAMSQYMKNLIQSAGITSVLMGTSSGRIRTNKIKLYRSISTAYDREAQ